MKNIFIISIFLYFTYVTISCNRKKDCVDNISVYLTKIPYKNNDIITFYNDTLGEKKDTIFIKLNNVYNNYYDNGDDYSEACGASIKVKYSNTYSYAIYQLNNAEDNHIEIYNGPHDTFNKDTVYFNKQDYIHARLFYLNREYLDSVYGDDWLDEYKSADGTILYNDFMVVDSPYFKLVEYTTLDKEGNKRTWRLQE